MPDFLQDLCRDIEEASVITLFAHQYPDLDASGSQNGIKAWIKANWPNKTVLTMGDVSLAGIDGASDQQVRDSLAIILDTSNSPRVEDQRWKTARKTYRIDHHVPVEVFADREWIDDNATATCEMAALLMEQVGKKLPREAAQALYEGLIADNLRFSVDKVRPESFRAAAYLVENGADVVEAARKAFASNYASFAYESKVRSKAVRKADFLYAVMDMDDYVSMGATFSFAKEKVYALADISDIEVWALFTRMEDNVHYAASLRSRTIPIRDLAVRYGGGGHDCASGIKNLSPADVAALIHELEQRSLDKTFAIPPVSL